MRKPSVKTLSLIFGDNAKQARRILELDRKGLESLPLSEELIKRAFGRLSTVWLQLQNLNIIGGFYGVESIETGKEWAYYLNSGDTYNGTLIYFRGNFRVSTLGDFVETMERQGVKFK